MRHILVLSVALFISIGLWNHDWTVIVAALVLGLIWPLIADEVYEVREERRKRELLDRLWDDDGDLPRSA